MRRLSDIFKVNNREDRKNILDKFDIASSDKQEVLNELDNMTKEKQPNNIGFCINAIKTADENQLYAFACLTQEWGKSSEYTFNYFVLNSNNVANMQGFTIEDDGTIKYKGATIYKDINVVNDYVIIPINPVKKTDLIENKTYYANLLEINN